MTRFLAGAVLGVAATLLVAVAVWLGVVYTGAYNVAASEPHEDAVRWTLDTTMHRSVARRAGAAPPEDVSEAMLTQGSALYAASCAHCHGAPGREAAGWSRGMRPEPPHLTEAATHWSGAEIRWIVENGIRMSGMPAFGARLGPGALDAVAAFVTQLPGLSADDYAALTGAPAGADGAGPAALAPEPSGAPDAQASGGAPPTD